MSREKITSDMIMSALGGVGEKWYALADPDSAAADAKKARTKKHFVLYEIKKLLGIRYLWAFLAIFLVLNSVIAFYSAGKTYAAYEPSQLISSFFEKYFDDPEELDAHYAEIQAFNKEQEELFMKAMQSGNYDFETESMPSIYSTDEDFPDSMLFHTLYSAVNAAADYPNVMQKVIERAVANLAEFKMMGIDEDSFTYRYQIRVIRLYEEVRDNVSIRVEYTHGWEEYFSYEIVNIFIFVFIIMLGSLIFAEEKQTGFLPIIRTSRYGRARTAAAKLITMLPALVRYCIAVYCDDVGGIRSPSRLFFPVQCASIALRVHPLTVQDYDRTVFRDLGRSEAPFVCAVLIRSASALHCVLQLYTHLSQRACFLRAELPFVHAEIH